MRWPFGRDSPWATNAGFNTNGFEPSRPKRPWAVKPQTPAHRDARPEYDRRHHYVGHAVLAPRQEGGLSKLDLRVVQQRGQLRAVGLHSGGVAALSVCAERRGARGGVCVCEAGRCWI